MKNIFKFLIMFCLTLTFVTLPTKAATIYDGNNHSYATAKKVGLNDTMKGELNHYKGDYEADFYKITVPSSSSYKINMNVKVVNDYVDMYIYNSKGTCIGQYCFTVGDLGFQIYNQNFYFDPGVYYIKLDTFYYASEANYTIKLKSTRINNVDYKSNTSFKKATSLKLNKKVTAVSSIYNVNSYYNYNDDDIFKFYVPSQKKIKIDLSTSHGFHLALYNSKGKWLDSLYKDKSGSLQKTLKRGTYYIGIDINDPSTDILNGEWNSFGGKYNITLVDIPNKVTISSVKSNAKKKITVKYKKVTGASGYQIAYQKSGSKSWKYTTVSSKSASKTLTKLTSKKKYKVKVRAYKTVSGKKYYGTYSATKTVKVK